MSDIADSDIFDVASVICCGGILLCYHLYTYAQVFLFDNHVIQLKKTFDVAPAWIDKHLEKEDPASVTLAVQTLRNTILISIFLGGNSFSYAFSILSQIKNETRTIDSAVSAIISSVLFLSFLNWAGKILIFFIDINNCYLLTILCSRYQMCISFRILHWRNKNYV